MSSLPISFFFFLLKYVIMSHNPAICMEHYTTLLLFCVFYDLVNFFFGRPILVTVYYKDCGIMQQMFRMLHLKNYQGIFRLRSTHLLPKVH